MTAFYPQTDGDTKRITQEILTSIRVYISYAQNNWATLLPSAMIAFNNRDNSKASNSLFFLALGYHLGPIKIRESKENYQLKIQKRKLSPLSQSRFAKAAMATAQQIMEHNVNRGRKPA